ncbi:hypothetical protein [Georgenia alba]|uniref:DUF4386 family protein n=1 Tax=Georgenia alba TaxID=2233858 RepID=A0ABW2Q607_9MICO
MSAHTSLRISATTRQRIAAAVLLLLGVVAYVLPTALHGNPPIDDAAATLDYVSSRKLWTLAHFANVAAILMWAFAVALLHVSGALPLGRGAVARMSWSVAGGAFAIYFGIHAVGLWSAAEQLGTIPEQTVIERTEALLHVLGSAAFVSQALVGVSVALLGVALMRRTRSSLVLGGVGILAGAGWATGAVMINFAIIVPFTLLTWAWVVVVAIVVLRTRLRSTATTHGP